MSHRISPRGLRFVKQWESFVPYVYDDKRAPVRGKYAEWDGSRPRGTLTIGYGHTNAARHPLKIKQGLHITEPQAVEILDVDLDECEDYVNRAVKVEITRGQFDALASITFNMGSGNMQKSSLLAKLNRGDYAGARAAFDLYIRSGGEVMRGLVRRRDGEQELWDIPDDDQPASTVVDDTGKADGVDDEVPPEPTDEKHHPAEVDAPVPATTTINSPEGRVAVTGGVGGMMQTVSEVNYAAKDAKSSGILELLGKLVYQPGFWIGVIILLLVVSYWFKWPKRFYERWA